MIIKFLNSERINILKIKYINNYVDIKYFNCSILYAD